MNASSMKPGRALTTLEPDVALTLSRRLRTACALHDAGVAIKRAQLRREEPSATEQQISHRLGLWLRTRPGAPYGDAEGLGKPAPDSR